MFSSESSLPTTPHQKESTEGKNKPQQTPLVQSPPDRSGSPGRNTFDIDSPEMRNYISRGRKPDGVPVTSIKIGFGVAEKKLIETSKRAALHRSASP